jgi:hypothetical protein
LQRLVADIYRLDGMGRVDYEPDPATSVAAQSTAAGRHPLDVFYDLLIADGCRAISSGSPQVTPPVTLGGSPSSKASAAPRPRRPSRSNSLCVSLSLTPKLRIDR